jgi:hypothetical protein
VTTLIERVRGLLGDVRAVYVGTPAQPRLDELAVHLDEPLRVALAGRVKAGKSTLLNALVGRRVAATDAGECTRYVTWYEHAAEAGAAASDERVAVQLVPDGPVPGSLRLELSGPNVPVELRVGLPSAWLERMTLIDTPGLGSLTVEAGRRTSDLLTDEAETTGSVDAVVYLLRHLHVSDVDFLELFHDARLGHATPVNAVGVLSRADEMGGGGPAALEQAARAAGDYRQDPRIRGLVHSVVPVAGLLAETGTSLTDGEYANLTTLTKVAPGTLGSALLSADRFVAADLPLDAEARQWLLRRLGMYGIRLCTDSIRRGSINRRRLATLLIARSGLPSLRRLLLTQFAERRDALKAETALRVIDSVSRGCPVPAAEQVQQAVERFRVGAHELVELRVLLDLRAEQIPADPDRHAALERLLGGSGGAATSRLGLDVDADQDTIDAAVAAERRTWRRVSQSQLAPPALVRAAQVAVRTCDGLATPVATSRAG